jgi:Fe-S cluster assembly protein SufD
MTNVSRLKTDAEQAIARVYQASLTSDHSIDDARSEAFAAFDAVGLPHRRIEEYKYTDLKALVRSFNPLAGPTSAEQLKTVPQPGDGAYALYLVDGVYRPELTAHLPDGVTVESLSGALSSGSIDLPALVEGPAIAAKDPIIALNAALMTDGIVIEVAEGVMLDKPIHLVHAITSETPVSVHTRSVVILHENARLGLIESYHAAVAGHQRTDVLNLIVDDGGKFEHAVAKTADLALDLATMTAIVGSRADVRSFALVTSGDVTRRQHFVRLEGDHTHLSLRGANLLAGKMHADTTLTVEHDSLDCQSRELYRTVIDGSAHGVFQGKVIVRPGAQKTDGKMASNALLLSESAEMDNKPELEIYADDVACGHGATCGEIDERPIFYLMSRGLPRPEAEALLIQSFVGEVIDSVGDGALGEHGEALREAFTGSIERWLANRASLTTGGVS